MWTFSDGFFPFTKCHYLFIWQQWVWRDGTMNERTNEKSSNNTVSEKQLIFGDSYKWLVWPHDGEYINDNIPLDIFLYFMQKSTHITIWKRACKCKCSLQFILRIVTLQNICYQVQQVVKWQFHCTIHTRNHNTQHTRCVCRNSTMCTQPIFPFQLSLSLSFLLSLSLSLSIYVSIYLLIKYQSKNSMFSYNNFFIKTSTICQSKNVIHIFRRSLLFIQLISFFVFYTAIAAIVIHASM